jgi:hypothetical protein
MGRGKILSLVHFGILFSSLPEISFGEEECKIPAWAKDKMFRHQQENFFIPMQFSRGELHLD